MQKTVLDSVNAILGGGQCVGVLHHGKKVRDSKMLVLGLVMMTCWITLAFQLNPAAHKILLKSQFMKTSFLETIYTTKPLAR
jgi:hypothetical protein